MAFFCSFVNWYGQYDLADCENGSRDMLSYESFENFKTRRSGWLRHEAVFTLINTPGCVEAYIISGSPMVFFGMTGQEVLVMRSWEDKQAVILLRVFLWFFGAQWWLVLLLNQGVGSLMLLLFVFSFLYISTGMVWYGMVCTENLIALFLLVGKLSLTKYSILNCITPVPHYLSFNMMGQDFCH